MSRFIDENGKETKNLEVPEKILKQLQEFIKNKKVIYYIKRWSSSISVPNYQVESSFIVIKEIRNMMIEDVFKSSYDEEQQILKKIYDLEQQKCETDKLKDSINNIKHFLK